MWRTVRRFLTLRWVTLHLLFWGAAVGMVFLGRWQLDVSNTKHFDLQNFGYSLQWWAFSSFALVFWAKLVRDAAREQPPTREAASGQLVRAGRGGVAPVGRAQLVAAPANPGEAPVVYRGYVMPQSSTAPARSDGDPLHASYNDYLWQLGLADSVPGLVPPASAVPAVDPVDPAGPQPLESGDRPSQRQA